MIGESDMALLRGVADSLERTVVPELARGPTRRQVQAAVAILRRIAFTADKAGPVMASDSGDIEDTLAAVIGLLAAEDSPRAQVLCARLRQGLDGPAAGPAARHAALEELLAGLQRDLARAGLAPATRTGIDRLLHGLFTRMVARDQTLIPPARER
jgi:hypothetical protein